MKLKVSRNNFSYIRSVCYITSVGRMNYRTRGGEWRSGE